MAMMIENVSQHLQHFNQDYVCEISNRVEIVETAESGAGTATFEIDGVAVKIKGHNNSPLLWALSERKCADGAFLTFDNNGTRLHIVELKGHVRPANWPSVKAQFKGMFLTSLAVTKILSIASVYSVTCYIAAQKDGMSVGTTASPTLLKTLVGGTHTLGGREDWETATIELPFGVVANLVKGWRDASGNVNFGQV